MGRVSGQALLQFHSHPSPPILSTLLGVRQAHSNQSVQINHLFLSYYKFWTHLTAAELLDLKNNNKESHLQKA